MKIKEKIAKSIFAILYVGTVCFIMGVLMWFAFNVAIRVLA